MPADRFTAETDRKFKQKYEKEINEIRSQTKESDFQLSNSKQLIEKALNICQNLSGMWVSADLQNKQQLQKIVFPEGLSYDLKRDTYRTSRMNELVCASACQSRVLTKNKTENSSLKMKNSPLVPAQPFYRTGNEECPVPLQVYY